MQPDMVYMSCLVLQVVSSWASFGPLGGFSKYVFGWAALGTPMVGCPEGMPTSVAPECLVDSKNRTETQSSLSSRRSRCVGYINDLVKSGASVRKLIIINLIQV